MSLNAEIYYFNSYLPDVLSFPQLHSYSFAYKPVTEEFVKKS